jgi:hypothetical protein
VIAASPIPEPKRPVRSRRQGDPSPARHRPGARSARRTGCRFHSPADQDLKGETSWHSFRGCERGRRPALRPHTSARAGGAGRSLAAQQADRHQQRRQRGGSLRSEIAHARKKDTIVFAPSLDGQTITLTSGELDITTGLTIAGPGATKLTISGGNKFRVFEVNASDPVVLSGLTISNGATVRNNAALPYAFDGGGILNLSTLTLSGCMVSGNSADAPAPSYGGGIYNAGTLTLDSCTVSSNYAYADLAPAGGAGIYNAGTLKVTNSTLYYNDTNGSGGAIYNAGVGAAVSLDAFTVANILNNADNSGLNGPTANIDGSYTAI